VAKIAGKKKAATGVAALRGCGKERLVGDDSPYLSEAR
jgi:hypothetical protein